MLFTIYASLFKVLTNLYIPKLDPIESISPLECPIIKTLSDSSIKFSKACATILALTLVLFSTSCVLPPKKTYFSFSLTTAWSPPLPRTISILAKADLYFS